MKNLKHMSIIAIILVSGLLNAQGQKSLTTEVDSQKNDLPRKVYVEEAKIQKLAKLCCKISKIEKARKYNADIQYYIPQHKIDFLKYKAEELKKNRF